MPISGCIDQFIDEVCAGKSNETPAAYRSKLTRLNQWMGERCLCIERLTPQEVEQFRRSLLGRRTKLIGAKIVHASLSPFTIRSCLMTVRHFLKWAAAHELTCSDLSTDLIVPKTPTPEPKAIEARAVLDLLDAASQTGALWEQARNLALIYVLRDTGARIGSVIGADIDDLDLKHRKLLVRTKGNKPHNLYLNLPTIAALRDWIHYRADLKPKDKKLFISCRGRGLRRSSIYSLIERIKHNADRTIQGRSNPHAYRHAWARDALTAGEDISKVARTLGNSVRVTAEYYALWSDAEIQEAHRKYSPGVDLPIVKPKDEHMY